MSDGGKGSSPRPFSVSQQEWDTRWDAIFSRDLDKKQQAQAKLEDNTGVTKNEFQDILSTEEALLRCNQETQEALRHSK